MSDGQVLNDDDRCHLDVLVEENDRLPEEAQDAKDAADDAERRLAEAEAEQHRLRFRLDDVENERNREREHRVDEARRHLDTIAERDRLRAALRAVMTETGTSTLAHHYARDALDGSDGGTVEIGGQVMTQAQYDAARFPLADERDRLRAVVDAFIDGDADDLVNALAQLDGSDVMGEAGERA